MATNSIKEYFQNLRSKAKAFLNGDTRELDKALEENPHFVLDSFLKGTNIIYVLTFYKEDPNEEIEYDDDTLFDVEEYLELTRFQFVGSEERAILIAYLESKGYECSDMTVSYNNLNPLN